MGWFWVIRGPPRFTSQLGLVGVVDILIEQGLIFNKQQENQRIGFLGVNGVPISCGVDVYFKPKRGKAREIGTILFPFNSQGLCYLANDNPIVFSSGRLGLNPTRGDLIYLLH